MKHKPLILLAFLLLLSVYSFGQVFNTWNEKEFNSRKTFNLPLRFDTNKATLTRDSSNALVLDSLVIFMKKHPFLKVEIDIHSDEKWGLYHSTTLNSARAKGVVYTLSQLGIEQARLIPNANFSTIPIPKNIPKESRKAIKKFNNRTEFRIISICYGHETFKWTDSVFYIGSSRLIYLTYDSLTGKILPESEVSLDTIVRFLIRRPMLKLEIAAHYYEPDSLLDKKLSQTRAQSCADYILSKGIDPSRIIAKGHWYIEEFETDDYRRELEYGYIYMWGHRTEVRIIGK